MTFQALPHTSTTRGRYWWLLHGTLGEKDRRHWQLSAKHGELMLRDEIDCACSEASTLCWFVNSLCDVRIISKSEQLSGFQSPVYSAFLAGASLRATLVEKWIQRFVISSHLGVRKRKIVNTNSIVSSFTAGNSWLKTYGTSGNRLKTQWCDRHCTSLHCMRLRAGRELLLSTAQIHVQSEVTKCHKYLSFYWYNLYQLKQVFQITVQTPQVQTYQPRMTFFLGQTQKFTFEQRSCYWTTAK